VVDGELRIGIDVGDRDRGCASPVIALLLPTRDVVGGGESVRECAEESEGRVGVDGEVSVWIGRSNIHIG
jgi:hypothetical protein